MAVEGRENPDGSVGGRVGWTEIEEHHLGVDVIQGCLIYAVFTQSVTDGTFKTVGLIADLTFVYDVVLAQRMAFELPVIQHSAEIRVADEVDPILVIDLAFTPVGGRPEIGRRRYSHGRLRHGCANLHQPVFLPVSQGVHHIEACLHFLWIGEIVYGRHIKHEAKVHLLIILQKSECLVQFFSRHRDDHVADHLSKFAVGTVVLQFFNGSRIHIQSSIPLKSL